MKKTEKYFYIGLAVLVVAVVVITAIDIGNNTEKKWKDAVENTKAYEELSSNSNDKSRAFKLTIDQLKFSNDSIIKELNKARKELGIKDSKLQSLQHISSNFAKSDTINMSDTVFRDNDINLDTLLSDEWYSLRVGLRYPSTIAVTPSFKSDKSIVVSTKRETVNPPKRFFLFRLFQKKHTILNVRVIEKNPYIQNQDNRFVEIVR